MKMLKKIMNLIGQGNTDVWGCSSLSLHRFEFERMR